MKRLMAMENGEDDDIHQNKDTTKSKRKQLGLSCMLNTEVGAVLAVIRRGPEFNPVYNISASEESYDSSLMSSLRSLRSLIFNPQQEWRTIDPSIYLSPFLDVIQSDDVPASATGVALSSLLKILKFEVFDVKTAGAKDAMESIVSGITSCRLEKTDPVSEDAVMMKILQVLAGIMNHKASTLLNDQAVCTLVNTCFQVVQQSVSRGDLLQRSARYTMHELIQVVFSRLPEIEARDGGSEGDSESDTDDDDGGSLENGYGVRCAIDIFHFLCSLLNVVSVVETDGATSHTADEDVQIFALLLINSAIELSGDEIGKHPKLLRMVQDDLFHHLIYYGSWSSSFVLSMICSTVLNAYHFLRRFIRFQLAAFFGYVLIRIATSGSTVHLQEVAVEGIINFCRQPTFIVEVYVNYDCDPCCRDVFEEVGRVLCKHSFAGNGPLTSLQMQAFEGLLITIHNIADNIDKDYSSLLGPCSVQITEYSPFWEEKDKEDDLEGWVEHVRVSKMQKKKLNIAANHFNRDNKKGLEYLKHAKLISDPPDPKSYAYFFRFTPGLDKKTIGEYLGDPDDFYLQVLKEFTETFHFNGMVLDTALRFYLESFWLPGESQKIQRILEAFAERFFDQQSSDMFASKDTVLILCYSLIMLNTDQHNPQVKKKMNEEDFIRNNRAINAGQDLPREYLSELFQSISNYAIAIEHKSTTVSLDMNPSRWIQLINRSKVTQSFIQCDFDRRICRDMFACIAGPSMAALSSFFEHAEEEELLHECIEGLFSIARIAQYGLEDTLDELITSFCKFTTLLNPYASTEETMFTFSHDLKPRMATVAVFTIANYFRDSIRGGWKNIIDCLLKLKRLKLLPQSVIDFDASMDDPTTPESGAISPSDGNKFGSHRMSIIMDRFTHLSSDNMEDGITLGSEFERNLKMIKLCKIGSIFSGSSNIPKDSLQNLGRSLIFSAAGKGQKFSTPVEEEETVGFCWDLITAIALANLHRFHIFWPNFHEYLLAVSQFPMFSPIPFAEKAILALLKICSRLFSTPRDDKLAEELIFKSITLMWKLDKEILDMCHEIISQTIRKIVIEYPANLQTQFAWKSILNLLSVAWRHPETYDLGIEALVALFSDGTHVSRTNYPYCIDCAFGCFLAKNSPVEKKKKILDLLADSTNLLIQWHRTQYSDPGSNVSTTSNTSSSSMEDNSRGPASANYIMNLFVKLGEAFRRTSLSRQEEIRNHAVYSLHKSFNLAEEMLYISSNCINYFNLVIFAMVDELHEKMLEYSRRENAEREMRSMEGTLKLAMELLTDMYLQSLRQISESPGFRSFWLGILRRMDTCMKADLGHYGPSSVNEIIPDLLKKIITQMKDEEILVPKDDDDMWEITYIQIQWICPAIKEELFPM
ncbi:PREDICTED: ARF guanine-nucleotide exchange factor GNL2 [Lupinus angustifolius]|uniref:ARF guanine-nucleotide exchange factor GNL2 n=1 Tax=Lupinus angustifolius TaxID=3871 RepID=UPI00092FB5F2|nr:PREDICTED: ARF guanine-nucleotide exchange factor GNL2 [Lupinus angustifolius]